MFDPHDDASMKRLRSSLMRSRKAMKPFADKRAEALKEMVGRHYHGLGTERARPLNVLELAASIYLQNLIATSPQVSVTPSAHEFTAEAYDLELAMNTLFARDELGVELESWVLEAMFSPLGVLKVFMDVQDVQYIDGTEVWSGPPTANAVLFDDWVQDMTAKAPHKVSFCGDRWQCPREWAETSGVLDPDVVAKLPRSEPRSDDDKYSAFRGGCDDDYREILELWDIWLPNEGKIVTLYKDFESYPPLREVDWSGPSHGPYHRLWFGAVPGSSLPNPPSWLWLDLHEVINTLWNKLIEQAKRQKTISATESGNRQDAKTLKESSDGDMVILDSLAKNAQLSSGGISQENFGFAVHANNAFNRMAGNLDALGGLGAMSGTVGQDELLTAGASQRLQKMQGRVYAAMTGVANAFAHHLDAVPTLELEIRKQSGNQEIPSVWQRGEMKTSPLAHKVTCAPYSLQVTSPEQELAKLRSVWQRDIMPAMAMFQAIGAMPNPEAYLKEVAAKLRLPQAIQFVTFSQGESQPSQSTAPPSTTAHQTAHRSTKTRAGQDEVLVQRMMAGANSPAGMQGVIQ